MKGSRKILLVAIAAGLLGAAASFFMSGQGFLYRTESGQRVLQSVMDATAPTSPEGLAIAERDGPVPTVTLPRLAGGDLTLPGDYAGRPLLINVWASWCGPCIEEMPELERFSVEQGANGTQVVGIALDDKASVEAFLKRVPVSYPIVLDQAGPADSSVQLGNKRGVLPYSVLVSADGRLLKQRIGPFEHGEISGWAASAP